MRLFALGMGFDAFVLAQTGMDLLSFKSRQRLKEYGLSRFDDAFRSPVGDAFQNGSPALTVVTDIHDYGQTATHIALHQRLRQYLQSIDDFSVFADQ